MSSQVRVSAGSPSRLAWSLYKCASLWRAVYGPSATERLLGTIHEETGISSRFRISISSFLPSSHLILSHGCVFVCFSVIMGLFCLPCYAGRASQRIGEHLCVPCCVPGGIITMRTKLRTMLGIEVRLLSKRNF